MTQSLTYVEIDVPIFAEPEAPPIFWLRANFNGTNTSFTNTQVVRTTDHGIHDGALYINNLGAGSIGISSNALALAPSGGNVCAYFGVIPRVKALAYQIRFSATNTGGQLIFGPMVRIHDNAAASDPDSNINKARGCIDLLGGAVIYSTAATSPFTAVATYSAGSAAEYIWLLGGWDSSGIPWDGSVDFTPYLYGKSLFYYDGSTWTLIVRDVNAEADSSYLSSGPPHNLGLFIDTSSAATCSHMIISDESFTDALVPTFLQTSLALNATATGTADQVLECKITRPSSGNVDVSFRFTDDANRWFIRVNSSGDLQLFERVASVNTQRGTTASAAIGSGGEIVTVYMEGALIRAFDASMGSNTQYASAATGLSATGFKVNDLGTGGAVTHAGSWRRAGYTSIFTPATSVSMADGRNGTSLTTDRQVTFVGDSLLDGNPNGIHRDTTAIDIQHMLGGAYLGANNFTGNNWHVTDRAVGGSGIADIVADEANVIATFSSSNLFNILVIHSGTKQIVDSPGTSAATISAMKSYIADMRTLALAADVDLTIILDSIIDRQEPGTVTNQAQFDADRAAYNAAMEAWAPANDVTFIDLDSLDDRLTDSTDTRYFRAGDPPFTGSIDAAAVHLNYWGQGLLAVQIFEELRPMLFATSSATEQTFRFAKDATYLPNSIDAIPSIREVKITPAIVSLGGDLGQRASVEVLLKDHRHIFASEDFTSGTFWGKFRARYGLRLRGYPLRAIQGTVGQTLEEMETRHYIIESTDGPTTKGEFKIIAKDILKFADGDRAQAPPLSGGFLLANLTTTQTDVTLSPTGAGDLYYLGAGYVAIGGNEIVKYNRQGIDAFDVLLVHADGNSPTSIIDALTTPHTITPVGNVTASASQSRFGGSSIFFDGTGDYLTLDGSSEFAFGTGDFCVDFWARFTSVATQQYIYDSRPTGTNGAYLTIYVNTGTPKIRVFASSADRIVGATTVVINTWYHIAVTRQGTTMRLFVNGVQDGSDTNSIAFLIGTSRPAIGSSGAGLGTETLFGYIDELRVSNGAARFTSTPFTVPAAAYSTSGSGDLLSIVRAQYNTVAATHTAGDRVQLCVEYLSADVADVIYDLLTTYAEVDPDFITLANWQTETGTYLSTLYSALIAEPTSVNQLVSELIEQASLAMWWDDLNEQIRLQVLRAVSTVSDVYNEDNMMADSLEVKEQPEKRISQVYTYFAKINPLVKEDQIDNYASSVFSIDEDAEVAYGSASIKKIFSRWIPSGGRSVAESVNTILLARFVTPPRRISFDVMRHSGDPPALGLGYQIEGWPFQDETGAPDTVPAQIVRLNPRADIFEVEAEEVFAGADAAVSSPDNHVLLIDANVLNVNLRTMHDSIYAAAVSGQTVTCTVLAGIVVGSSSAATPAFDVGTWAAGVTIDLTVLGTIEGAGGAGGPGNTGTGSAGSAGGTALYTRQAITLRDLNGAIWGGGGGGGAGGGGHGTGGTGGGGAGQLPASGATTTTGGAGGLPVGGFLFPAGNGGAGGGPGLAGSSGAADVFAGAAGGAAGKAIDGVSFCTTAVGPGDRRGGQIN